MPKIPFILSMSLLLFVACSGAGAATLDERAEALEIYRDIVAMRTASGHGQVPRMAAYLADRLRAAGFAPGDIDIDTLGETAGMVVRYRASGRAAQRPILFLAHMDVVDALAADWALDPFAVTERDGYYVGRGTADNKYGVMTLTHAFMRLKRAGFEPTRDLYLVFSGDEETEMDTTKRLAARPELARAEFALNADAGGGLYGDDDTPLGYRLQSAEKTYATFVMTARNPGGHSSRPRPDNAIYELADALAAIRDFQFPAVADAVTRPALRAEGERTGGLIGAALRAFADDPSDSRAVAVLRSSDSHRHLASTTCVATMLKAGHAENALPQSATATINCRIFPGETVAGTQAALVAVVANPRLQWTVLHEPVPSPASPPRADVVAAIGQSIHRRFPGLGIVPSMSSGGTDGMHFRRAGIPTYGASPVFARSGESRAHGLDERLRVAEFDAGLDHWLVVIRALAGRDASGR